MNIANRRPRARFAGVVLASVVLIGIGLAILSTAASAASMTPIPGDPVDSDAGKISGTFLASGIHAYFGIPFAAPPLRENRWRAPQPVTPWRGVYNADRKQPECSQPLRSSSANHYFGDEAAGEDCLYLNVWTPARRSAGLAVVVWLHGGGEKGSSTMAVYDGEALAKKGIVYVAANYRLGLFGLMAHPGLTKESGHNTSGNWTFLDQLAVLKWVQRNIAGFGGDPAKVTLVGQSWGAMSISELQASPLAKGLFIRAVGLSGTALTGDGLHQGSLAEAESQGLKLQAALKASSLAEMRALPADKVMAVAKAAGLQFEPDIDGYFMPQTVDRIFAAGQQNDVTVLAGSTANDAGTAPAIRKAQTLAEYRMLALQTYGDRADQFLRLFPADSDAEARAQAELVGRSSGYAVGARNWARAQAATGKQPAYLYIASRVQPFAPGVAYSDFDPATAGAYHMSDVPYWLGTLDSFNLFRTTRAWTAWDRDLSDAMQDVLVAFARSGDPSTARAKFTPYNPAHEARVDFGDAIVTETLDSKAQDFIGGTISTPAPAAQTLAAY